MKGATTGANGVPTSIADATKGVIGGMADVEIANAVHFHREHLAALRAEQQKRSDAPRFKVAAPGEWHLHACAECSVVWGHKLLGEDELDQQFMAEKHMCPNCARVCVTHLHLDDLLGFFRGDLFNRFIR